MPAALKSAPCVPNGANAGHRFACALVGTGCAMAAHCSDRMDGPRPVFDPRSRIGAESNLLPPGSPEYQSLCRMMGTIDDSSKLSMVLQQDLDPRQFVREEGLLSRVAPQLLNMLARGQAWEESLSSKAAEAAPRKDKNCESSVNVEPDEEPDDGIDLGLGDDLSDEDGCESVLDAGSSTSFADSLWEFAITPKVLLTFMTACMPFPERMRLVAWAKNVYPLPLVMRHPEEDGRFVVDALHMQHQLNGTLMASIPFDTCGNSSLLRLLFRRSFELSPSRVSPLHAGSVDISFTTHDEIKDYPIEPFHILDLHVGHGRDLAHEEDRTASRNFMRCAQYFLIHFPMEEGKQAFEHTKRILLKGVWPYLQTIFCDNSLRGCGKRVMLLARDVDVEDKHLRKKQDQLESQFKKWERELDCSITYDFVPNVSTLKGVRCKQEIERIYDKLRRHFLGASRYNSFWEAFDAFEHASNQGSDPCKLRSTQRDLEQRRASRRVYECIGSTIQKVDDWSSALKWSSRPFVLESHEEGSDKLTAAINRRSRMQLPDIVSVFLNTMHENTANLQEWKQQLVRVAGVHAAELSRLQGEYLKLKCEYEATNDQISQELEAHSAIVTHGLEGHRDALKSACARICTDISSKVMTTEKLWREAVEFYDCHDYIDENLRKEMTFSTSALVAHFTQAMQSGFAMELLDGDNIVVHPEFLEAVFMKFGERHRDGGCRTISILGPQSSGKSTLANALWGGEFATSAGRCTKGLYASVFRTDVPELPSILFLDTEGLCSVENDSEFDQKLALLTIAMSDVILINVRGEVDSKVSAVLQTAVFCLRQMSIVADQRKPELVFVQRDMVDFSKSKSDTTMTTIEKNMRDATKLLKNSDGTSVKLKDILYFDRDSLVLMPSAFQSLPKVFLHQSGEVQAPNPEFGSHCLELRKKIISLALHDRCNVSNFQEWGQRFCTVKKTIDKFKDLANFEGVLALQTRQAFDEQLKRLLDVHVYGEAGGSPAAVESLAMVLHEKQQELEKHVSDLQKDVHTGSDDQDRNLDKVKDTFEQFCRTQVDRFAGPRGTIVEALRSYCKTNKAISAAMLDEGVRMLRSRAELFATCSMARFDTLHQRHRAHNLNAKIFDELREELGRLRKGLKQISETDAEAHFSGMWERAEEKLTAALKRNRLDYKSLVQQVVESFRNTERTFAVSVHTIMSDSADFRMRSVIFGNTAEHAPVVPAYEEACMFHGFYSYCDPVADLAMQFDSCISLLECDGRTGRRKSNMEGLWSYTVTGTKKEKTFTICRQADGTLKWTGQFSGWAASGCLEEESSTGRVFCTLKSRYPRGRFEVISHSDRAHAGAIEFRFWYSSGYCSPAYQARKTNRQADALANVAEFFGVDCTPGTSSPSEPACDFSWAVFESWSNVYSSGHDASQKLEDQQKEVKANTLVSVYRWMSHQMAEAVAKVDDELSNLNVLIRTLHRKLTFPTEDTAFAGKPMLWEFTAAMKNECLRVFCKWVRSAAERKRAQSEQSTVAIFRDSMEPLRRSFINSVTQVQTDQNSASTFLEEFWLFTNHMTKQELINKVVSCVASRFSSPEQCLEHMDAVYIGTLKASPEEIFKYITSPAEEMQRYVAGLCDDEMKKSVQEMQSKWARTLKSIQTNLLDLCRDLALSLPRRVAMSSEEPSEQEATFAALLKFINEGRAAFPVAGSWMNVSTDIRVYGEDHGKVTLTITTVDAISHLETFLSFVIKGLEAWSHTEVLRVDMKSQKAKIVDQWIGCREKCPYCKKKCTLCKHGADTKHYCKFHQPIGFGGVKMEANKKPLFIHCDEFDNQARGYVSKSTGEVLEFQTHLKKEHSDWHISMEGDGQAVKLKMRAGYIKIWDGFDHYVRKKLCSHYDMENISWDEATELAKSRKSVLKKLQVALVLDTTGSMAGEIRQCQTDCLHLVSAIKDQASKQFGSSVDVQFAFCGYKDHGDSGHLDCIDFQGCTGYHAVEGVIKRQAASGGGDEPEDILGAFRKVVGFRWAGVDDSAVKRIIILIADAPCHGTQYSNGGDDHEGDGRHMPAALKALTDKNVSCLLARIRPDRTAKMEAQFRDHWAARGGEDCRFQVFDNRREAGDRILDGVVGSLPALIQSSV